MSLCLQYTIGEIVSARKGGIVSTIELAESRQSHHQNKKYHAAQEAGESFQKTIGENQIKYICPILFEGFHGQCQLKLNYLPGCLAMVLGFH